MQKNYYLFIFFSLAIFLSKFAWALDQEEGKAQIESLNAQLHEIQTYLRDPSQESLKTFCLEQVAAGASKVQVEDCQRFYKKLFNDQKLRIDILVGYSDQDDFVEDVGERISFIQLITSQCPPSKKYIMMCGFSRDPDDADKFYKKITDEQNKTKIVELRISNSALSFHDQENRKNPQQKVKSEKTQRNFVEALKNSDVVYYWGHSRDGGGPDFSPPLKTKNNHVDYAWYKKNKPGLNTMLEAVKQRDPNKELVIGLFSCSSLRHFFKSLKGAGVKRTILTNDLVSDDDILPAMIKSLNSLLNLSCDKSLGIKDPLFQALVL